MSCEWREYNDNDYVEEDEDDNNNNNNNNMDKG